MVIRTSLMILLVAALAVPTVALAAPPDRYEAPVAGPVDDGRLTAWLNFAGPDEVCAGETATTVELAEVRLRNGAVVTHGVGEVPVVVLPSGSDPCGADAVAVGQVTLRYNDNDSEGAGGRGNAFGVGFNGVADDGRRVSGHARFVITGSGTFRNTTNKVQLR